MMETFKTVFINKLLFYGIEFCNSHVFNDTFARANVVGKVFGISFSFSIVVKCA